MEESTHGIILTVSEVISFGVKNASDKHVAVNCDTQKS